MEKNGKKLLILWTSGNREVAMRMVFMYALNSLLKGWWDEVTLLVWGPSARLLAQDKELQGYAANLFDSGVRVIACKQCAEEYGIVERLEAIHLEVFYTGQFLTDWIQSGEALITL